MGLRIQRIMLRIKELWKTINVEVEIWLNHAFFFMISFRNVFFPQIHYGKVEFVLIYEPETQETQVFHALFKKTKF